MPVDYSLAAPQQDPMAQQKLMALLMQGRERQQGQESLAAANQQTRKFDELAAIAPLLNNRGAVAATQSAQKSAQAYAPEKLGQTGFMLPGTGEFIESPMYADERDAQRQSVLQNTMERVRAQREATEMRVDQQREATQLRADVAREATRVREVLGQSMMALREQGLSNTAEYRQGMLDLKKSQLDVDKAKDAEKASEKAEKAAKGKVLPFSAIEKMTTKEVAASKFGDLTSSFKDDYSGTPGLAKMQNTAGSYLGGRYADQSNWWKNYNDQKNAIRHELFGSALTAPEKAAFDAANIVEGMDPKQIRIKLGQQHAAAAKAYMKIRNNTGASGYDVSGFQDIIIPEAALPGGGKPPANPDDALINKYLKPNK